MLWHFFFLWLRALYGSGCGVSYSDSCSPIIIALYRFEEKIWERWCRVLKFSFDDVHDGEKSFHRSIPITSVTHLQLILFLIIPGKEFDNHRFIIGITRNRHQTSLILGPSLEDGDYFFYKLRFRLVHDDENEVAYIFMFVLHLCNRYQWYRCFFPSVAQFHTIILGTGASGCGSIPPLLDVELPLFAL